jgi:N4-gp56 family major capsid protein
MSKLKRLLLNILMFPVFPIFSALTGNISTDTTELVHTFYDKTALKAEKPRMVLEQFAVKSKDIPRSKGATVAWWKTIPLPVTVAELTEGESPAATDLQFQNVTATVGIHGKVIAVSEFLELIAIDPELSTKSASLGDHRGRYINRMYWEALVKNLYPMRIDASATYETTGAEDGTATESTVVIGDASLSTACSAGGVIVITSGNNKGMSGYISGYSDPAITISTTKPSYALNELCTVGDTFKTANSTGLTAANPLTCAGVAKGVVILMINNALPVDGGYFLGVLSPFTQYDIRNDSAWINANQYAGSAKLFNNEIGSWGGIKFVMDTEPWRSTAGTMGTYAAAGPVFHTPIFGQECYAGVRIQGVQDELIFHNKKQTGDNLEMYSTAGWKAHLVCKVLNACWGVQILSGATSIS